VDVTSLIITFLLAGLMLYLLVRLPLAILGNLRAGHTAGGRNPAAYAALRRL
jgi:hypothetical protein